MKKTSYLVLIFLVFIYACNDQTNKTNDATDNTEKTDSTENKSESNAAPTTGSFSFEDNRKNFRLSFSVNKSTNAVSGNITEFEPAEEDGPINYRLEDAATKLEGDKLFVEFETGLQIVNWEFTFDGEKLTDGEVWTKVSSGANDKNSIDKRVAEIMESSYSKDSFMVECGGGWATFKRKTEQGGQWVNYLSIDFSGEHGGEITEFFYDRAGSLALIRILDATFNFNEESMAETNIYIQENEILKAEKRSKKAKILDQGALDSVPFEKAEISSDKLKEHLELLEKCKGFSESSFEEFACQ